MTNSTEQKPAEQYMVRLRPDVYDQIVKALPTVAVNNDTSPLQAGYQLGVQKVLELLRKDYLVNG